MRRAHQYTIFQILECSNESSRNSSCTFWNQKGRFYSNFPLLFILLKGNLNFEHSKENSHSCHAIFETTLSKFTQILYHCPVLWKITPLYFFSSNLIYFLQRKPTEVQVFRLSTARVKVHRISYVTFRTKSQFSFKVWTTLHCNARSFFCTFLAGTLYALDKSNTSTCKFPDL